MDNYIEKIFNLLNSSIVTPYNLLQNAKLENYKYVKYYKGEQGLIAEMDCVVDEEDTIFLYYFNENDHLQKIYMKQNGTGKFVFDRNNELEKTKEEYHKVYVNKFNKGIV
ncbi:hypothetical protein [Tepidibacter hydrothermalis]|uniref:Uncharacterized protein n=1 Tax=Tepidibacter hydrothermalis TaxID=3036126 RepID=A0ABY8EDT1_9FIRM|nr:hypothetical protein [Tepidibacter hydrothermalis]WFD09739.1 hypothetical protein P4S50_15280 [Tepidibacter hydrothermalis]